MIKAKYFIIIISFALSLPSVMRAQVYTFDFLTYSDQSHESNFTLKKWKITSYIFKGINEFDENGKADSEDISYSEWYIYVSYRLYNGKNIKINSDLRIGSRFAQYAFGGSWCMPWLWANLKVPIHFPLWLRVGFEFGKIGSAMWIEDNEFDVSLSSRYVTGFSILDASISYRIRGGMNHTVVDFGGLYNQAGNEIHYKFEPSKKITQNTQLSLFIMGYHSGNKKYHGKILPDSESFKTALGTSFTFRRKSGKIFVLSFLLDFWGRYDKKGFAIVFNVAK